MSGHSKWATIKRKKGATDAARGKLFTKLGREISVAVKNGGADPASNSSLRDAITKAKQNNMPNDNIDRIIKKASGDTDLSNYEEMTYEGYGAGGVAFIVKTLTDNKNRTAGDVRHAFDKFGGSLGTTGCVSYLFQNTGVIIIQDTNNKGEEYIYDIALNGGASDIEYNDSENIYEITSEPESFHELLKVIEESQEFTILSSGLELIPVNNIKPSDEHKKLILKLIEMLEDNDDVIDFFHNGQDIEEEEDNG